MQTSISLKCTSLLWHVGSLRPNKSSNNLCIVEGELRRGGGGEAIRSRLTAVSALRSRRNRFSGRSWGKGGRGGGGGYYPSLSGIKAREKIIGGGGGMDDGGFKGRMGDAKSRRRRTGGGARKPILPSAFSFPLYGAASLHLRRHRLFSRNVEAPGEVGL